ncbi:MAG: M14 family zinc carboxypeptidase, partial [Candidatus Poseidoniia archaeon]
MNRISSIVIALMLTVTTMSTGSIENPDFKKKDNMPSGFDSHENDTIDRTNTFPFDVFFDDYYDTSGELYSELFAIQAAYPEIVEIYTLTDMLESGGTWQNNEIYGLKISDNVANEPDYYDDPDEETFFIVGNHHAREWMTVVTPVYFAYFLTHFYGM